MSSRALRRLKGKQRGQEALDLGDLGEELGQAAEDEEPLEDVGPPSKNSVNRKAKKNKTQKNLSNIYELVRFIFVKIRGRFARHVNLSAKQYAEVLYLMATVSSKQWWCL